VLPSSASDRDELWRDSATAAVATEAAKEDAEAVRFGDGCCAASEATVRVFWVLPLLGLGLAPMERR
jgi:hypothetical protein